jgi:rare lipoprotein A
MAASSGEAAGGATADIANSGVGLKPLPGFAADDAQAAHAVPADQSARLITDKSLLPPVKRGALASRKLRLGRELGAGVASWYGLYFHGRRTASGEKYDRYALTAAHKTLPLGTRVVVSNPRTGKQIVVRINDRGPYVGHRILDLSEAAASALGLKTRGHDWVVLNAVLPKDTATRAYAVSRAAAVGHAPASPDSATAVAALQTAQTPQSVSAAVPAEGADVLALADSKVVSNVYNNNLNENGKITGQTETETATDAGAYTVSPLRTRAH